MGVVDCGRCAYRGGRALLHSTEAHMSHPLPHVHNVYGAWYDYVPAYAITKKLSQEAGKLYYGEKAQVQKGAVGGTIVDHAGRLGKPGARVPAAALKDAIEGNPPGTTPRYKTIPDDKIEGKTIALVASIAVLALGVAFLAGRGRG